MRSTHFVAPVLLALSLVVACADDGTDGRPPGADGSGARAGSAAGGSSGAAAGASAGGPAAGASGTGGGSSPTAGAGGTSNPSGGTGGTGGAPDPGGSGGTGSAPSAGAGGSGSAPGGGGGAGGSGPPPGGSGSGGAGASPSTGGTGGTSGGPSSCVGEVDDTEPNDSLATAYDLGTLEPDFEDDCGGTTPQVSFDGSTGPGDADYAKVIGAEKNVKCSHRPELFVFEKTNVSGCLVAKCDEGSATYTCKGGAGADLGNGYYGCCGDFSKAESIQLQNFTCSGSKGSAKLIVKISPLPGATTCQSYGVLVMF